MMTVKETQITAGEMVKFRDIEYLGLIANR